jgi:general secretion pathway protein B
MSYILDALKKAEQERKLGKAPDFMDDHGRTPRRRNKRAWAYALLAAFIAVSGGLGWWLGHERQADDRLPFQSSGVRQDIAEARAQKAETPAPAQPAVATAQTTQPREPQAAEARKTETPPAVKPPLKAEAPKKPVGGTAAASPKPADTGEGNRPDPKRIYNYDDLPGEIKKEIATPVISTHMYSNDPADRLVSINGNIGREKQEIMPGTTLDSILPDGAILRHKGYRIKVRLR